MIQLPVESARIGKDAPHEDQVARYKAEVSPSMNATFANAEQCVLQMAVGANARRDVCRP